jgi:hypothetical protein
MDVLITLYDCIGTIYEAGDTYHSTHLISFPIFIYVMNYVVGSSACVTDGNMYLLLQITSVNLMSMGDERQ